MARWQQGIVGYDPVTNLQVTAAEIARCEKDAEARLKLLPPANPAPKKGPRRALHARCQAERPSRCDRLPAAELPAIV